MKKPTEAIERMRRVWGDDLKEVLAYLDSIPEWPADLTRERLGELADQSTTLAATCDALRRLAAIAPKREKRKVELWKHESWEDTMSPHVQYAGQSELTDGVGGWCKVGEVEIDK